MKEIVYNGVAIIALRKQFETIYDKNGFDATASGFIHGDAVVLLLFGPVVVFLLLLLLILF